MSRKKYSSPKKTTALKINSPKVQQARTRLVKSHIQRGLSKKEAEVWADDVVQMMVQPA